MSTVESALEFISVQKAAAQVESCARTLRRMRDADPEKFPVLTRIGNRDFLIVREWELYKRELLRRSVEQRRAS